MDERDGTSRVAAMAQKVQLRVDSWSAAKQDFARRVSSSSTVVGSRETSSRDVKSREQKS